MLCRAEGDANLSYESLTSPATRQMLRELPTTNPEFFTELTRKHNTPPVLSNIEVETEDMGDLEIDIPGDDCAVPLEAVQDAVHGLLPADDVEQEFVVGQHNRLVSAAEAEETLIESVNGVVVDTTSTAEVHIGRGKRKKFRNTNYNPADFEFTHDSNVPSTYK
jgi:hypothetical protein